MKHVKSKEEIAAIKLLGGGTAHDADLEQFDSTSLQIILEAVNDPSEPECEYAVSEVQSEILCRSAAKRVREVAEGLSYDELLAFMKDIDKICTKYNMA